MVHTVENAPHILWVGSNPWQQIIRTHFLKYTSALSCFFSTECKILRKIIRRAQHGVYYIRPCLCVAYYTITGRKKASKFIPFFCQYYFFLSFKSSAGVLMLAASDSNEPAQHQRVYSDDWKEFSISISYAGLSPTCNGGSRIFSIFACVWI